MSDGARPTTAERLVARAARPAVRARRAPWTLEAAVVEESWQAVEPALPSVAEPLRPELELATTVVTPEPEEQAKPTADPIEPPRPKAPLGRQSPTETRPDGPWPGTVPRRVPTDRVPPVSPPSRSVARPAQVPTPAHDESTVEPSAGAPVVPEPVPVPTSEPQDEAAPAPVASTTKPIRVAAMREQEPRRAEQRLAPAPVALPGAAQGPTPVAPPRPSAAAAAPLPRVSAASPTARRRATTPGAEPPPTPAAPPPQVFIDQIHVVTPPAAPAQPDPFASLEPHRTGMSRHGAVH